MNAFDFSILSFLNRFAGQYLSFDKALVFLCNNGFFRGGVIAALCWWAWFKNGEDKDKNKEAREVIISTMLACLVSILFARLVVLAFPFRVRPISDPTNGFHFPAAPIDWHNWSSFPSDHAIMFFTLTTGLFFISRVLGWIALMDSVFLVCLPRIYLGPSDRCIGRGSHRCWHGSLGQSKSLQKSCCKSSFPVDPKKSRLILCSIFPVHVSSHCNFLGYSCYRNCSYKKTPGPLRRLVNGKKNVRSRFFLLRVGSGG